MVDNSLPVEFDPGSGVVYPNQPSPDYSGIDPVLGKLFGVGGYERYQTWPERMIRSGSSAPGDAYAGLLPIESPTGYPGSIAPSPIPSSESEIARVQDLAGMAGMSGIGMTPKGALGTSGSKLEGFYSNLERTIANSKVDKATPEQWTSYLKNQPGIKSEELEFGLNNLPDKILSKAELEQHIEENGVKLGEVWKTNKDTGVTQRDPDGTILPTTQETKYSSYQLPGAEPNSYRELLLTIPTKQLSEAEARQVLGAKPDAILAPADIEYASRKAVNEYKSSHWDEPNVLAHIRMNDRDIPNVGKTLHIEEIQSDWHQAGRKQGYKGQNKEEIPQGWGDTSNNNGTVPNAPFKKSWDELALKRVLIEAVKNDYDAVSWTPGEAQAARYDLSKQVDGILATRNKDGNFQIVAKNKGDRDFLTPIAENVPASKLPDYVGKDLAEKIVDQVVDSKSYSGLDLKVGGEGMKAFYDKMLVNKADQLVKKMGGKVEYEELPSGSGILPEGGRVHPDRYYLLSEEQKKSLKQETTKIPLIRITPAMREKIKNEGFPLFTAPVYVPVNSPPDFGEHKLTKVDHNPFIDESSF